MCTNLNDHFTKASSFRVDANKNFGDIILFVWIKFTSAFAYFLFFAICFYIDSRQCRERKKEVSYTGLARYFWYFKSLSSLFWFNNERCSLTFNSSSNHFYPLHVCSKKQLTLNDVIPPNVPDWFWNIRISLRLFTICVSLLCHTREIICYDAIVILALANRNDTGWALMHFTVPILFPNSTS